MQQQSEGVVERTSAHPTNHNPLHGEPKIRAWRDCPTVAKVEKISGLPIAHVIIHPFMVYMTWDELHTAGQGCGDIINAAIKKFPSLVQEFLPELSHDDAAWQISACGGHDGTFFRIPVVYMLIGHKELFGPTGILLQPSDLHIRPDVLIAEAREQWKKYLRHEREAND